MSGLSSDRLYVCEYVNVCVYHNSQNLVRLSF